MPHKVQVNPIDESVFNEQFSGSPHQRCLHNRLMDRLEKKRSTLETATPETLSKIQGEISELRGMLGLLHEKDSPNLKEYYG